LTELQTGRWSTRSPSKPSDLERELRATAALLLLGAAIALLHSRLNYSLGLPGHHGLELYTALLFARLVTQRPWAAVTVATGLVAGDLAFAADFLHNLKHVPLYFLAGAIVDLSYRRFGARCRTIPFAACIGAVAHVSKTLIMTAVALAAGAAFGFQRHGPWFPVMTHAAFGAIGAICGAILARAWLQQRSTRT
jgi:hypothetical protein